MSLISYRYAKSRFLYGLRIRTDIRISVISLCEIRQGKVSCFYRQESVYPYQSVICRHMAKKVQTVIKLQIQGGKANPAPPVGPALGQHGLNIQDFCTQFNDKTKDKMGDVVPVEITVYDDRSFDFIMKTPPAAELLKKAAKAKKGAANPLTDTAGTVTKDQVREIAEIKMVDLNANDIEAAAKIIEGTARSMGIKVGE